MEAFCLIFLLLAPTGVTWQVIRMPNIAEALEAVRESEGWSYREVRDMIRARMGGTYCPTEQTISQYHRADRMPAKPDPTLLLALAITYQDAEVSRCVAELLDDIAELLFSSLQEVCAAAA